jgi:Papain family cysteine protease
MAAAIARGRVLNVRPSPRRAEDHTPAAAEAAGHLRPIDPPGECDLRAPWYAVGDQGKTGSCIGWALGDSVLWRQLVRAGRLAEHDRLSPRFIWMAAKELRAKQTAVKGETDWRPSTFLEQGDSDVKSGLDVARTYGAALERDLPWDDGLYAGGIDEFYASAGERRITHYYRLDPEEESGEAWFEYWRRWLHQHGPVLIALGVDRHFADGEPVLDEFDATSVADYHAAALVGYGEHGFIIRCSWGTDWGRNGYAAATEGYLEQATLESYGVVV